MAYNLELSYIKISGEKKKVKYLSKQSTRKSIQKYAYTLHSNQTMSKCKNYYDTKSETFFRFSDKLRYLY